MPESKVLPELVPQIELSKAEQAERRKRFRGGAAIEFADLEEHRRAGALDRLREAEPVSWVPALGGWLAGWIGPRSMLLPALAAAFLAWLTWRDSRKDAARAQ